MAKFCGKCGSPLNDEGLCPNCRSVLDRFESQFEGDALEITPMGNEPVGAEPQKPKKKNFIPVIIAAAAVVVVGALVACAFIFHWFGLGKSDEKKSTTDSYVSSQSQAFVRTSYGKVWISCNIDEITGDEKDLQNVVITDEDKKICVTGYQMGRDGDTFYGVEGDNRTEWRKVTVTGENTAKSEVWVDEDTLKNSVLAMGDIFARDVAYFSVDGDYVYACVVGDAEFFASHKELNYRIVRADKSGKSIEFVGDESVRANEFVVKDGWIYYVDNGYTVNGEKLSYDFDRAGIYKIKTDGTEKTRIFDKNNKDKEDASYDDVSHENAGGLTLCGDRLYFCDLSDGSSCLASISLDGSDFKRYGNVSINKFTLDPGAQKAYCVSGYYGKSSVDKQKLYAIDLESGTSEYTGIETRDPRPYGMTVDGGYLYVGDMTRAFRYGDRGYYRISLSDFKVQSAEITEMEPASIEKDDMGFQKKINKAVYGIHWEDMDKELAL